MKPELSKPFWSLVVLTKKRPDSLKHCLRSVGELVLPKRPVEVLVVSDTAESENPLREVSGPADVRVLFTGGLGVGGAKNFALRQASGEWVALIADDYSLPKNYLCAAEDFVHTHPEACVLTFNISPPVDTLWGRVQRFYFQMTLLQTLRRETLKGQYAVGDALPVSRAAFLNRQAILDLGGFDEALSGGEDFGLSLKLKQQGVDVFFAKDVQIIHHEPTGLRELLSQRVRYSKNFWKIKKQYQTNRSRNFGLRHVWLHVSSCLARWLLLSLRVGRLREYFLYGPFVLLFLATYWFGVWHYSRRPDATT